MSRGRSRDLRCLPELWKEEDMAFSSVPEESKNQINKAGKILVRKNAPPRELRLAKDLVNRWRACHAYPINTFQATLRTRLRSYPDDSIVAQRLKRMPTIIDKLQRYPAMKLTTMQDIGGLRAILVSTDDVFRLADKYRKSTRLGHELTDEKDYISDPRSEDGYRSLHLVYKYRNTRALEYRGLRIEMQIRTRLQHIWATAVESMGTFLGQALKSRQGDQVWLDFFALVSSAFALEEGCPPVPRFANLSKEATYAAVAETEEHIGALAMMRGLSVAANAINRTDNQGKGWSYHLIILNSEKRTVRIKPYDRDSFEKAVSEYGRAEASAANGERIEPVLVSAGPMDKLRRAYPNFFLDIGDFAEYVRRMCRKGKA